jgi:hypothetical protein
MNNRYQNIIIDNNESINDDDQNILIVEPDTLFFYQNGNVDTNPINQVNPVNTIIEVNNNYNLNMDDLYKCNECMYCNKTFYCASQKQCNENYLILTLGLMCGILNIFNPLTIINFICCKFPLKIINTITIFCILIVSGYVTYEYHNTLYKVILYIGSAIPIIIVVYCVISIIIIIIMVSLFCKVCKYK